MKRKKMLNMIACILTVILILGLSPQCSWGLTVIDIDTPVLKLTPLAPSDLAVKLGSNITVKLTWTDNSINETGFVIQRRVQNSTYSVDLVTLPANTTSYTDQLNVNYGQFGLIYYHIKAVNNSGDSAYSNEISLKLEQPQSPKDLTLVLGYSSGKSGINLSWLNMSPNLTDYFKILRSTNNGDYENIGVTKDDYYFDSTISPNTTYSYMVESVGYFGGSMSGASKIATLANIDPPPAEPTTDSAIDTGTEGLDFDTASDWAKPEIQEAYDLDLTTDTILNHFDRNITRKEFCEIAVKLYEALSDKTALPAIVNPFTDTSNSSVLKAFDLGIIKGTSDTTFSPDNPITRQEICVMIYRTLKADNPNLDMDTSGVSVFSDESSIASWAIDAVRYANKNDIMKGTGGSKISPLNNTSREQAIILLKRTYENFN